MDVMFNRCDVDVLRNGCGDVDAMDVMYKQWM